MLGAGHSTQEVRACQPYVLGNTIALLPGRIKCLVFLWLPGFNCSLIAAKGTREEGNFRTTRKSKK